MSQATQLLLVLILAGSLCGAGWLLVSERRPARRTARRPGTPAVIRASAPVPPAPRAPQPGRASIRS
ncbi:MAG TPA: hypothetical protein VJT31_22735, partial [Rugosimonospora sp.]|nr:hypothetical protein [Rugosimonospora sp.]